VLAEHARCIGAQPALTQLDSHGLSTRTVSFAKLNALAERASVRLRQQSKRGDRVLISVGSSLEFAVAFFACLRAGLIAVPCPSAKRELGRIENICRDCDASLWICSESLAFDANGGASVLAGLIRFDSDSLCDDSTDALPIEKLEIVLENIAFLQYSSGSTGMPKGVKVSHANLIHNLQTMKSAFGHRQGHTVMATWLPLFHDMGLIGMLLSAVYVGVPCFMMSPSSFLKRPYVWLETISRHRVTYSGAPNFAYGLCVRRIGSVLAETLDLSCWDIAFNGAEPISPFALRMFSSHFANAGFRRTSFFPCYGLAEATLFATGGQPPEVPSVLKVNRFALEQGFLSPSYDPGHLELVNCGRIQGDQELLIVAPSQMNPLEDGLLGEICISGPSVMEGYWNNPAADAEAFFVPVRTNASNSKDRFLRTGDLGFMHRGCLFVTGRLKDLVIVRGRKLHPEDMEQTIRGAHAAIANCTGAVFSIAFAGAEKVVAIQEVSKDCRNSFDQMAIERDVAEAVTAIYQIQLNELYLVKPGSIPRTSSGKVQRSACKAQYLTERLDLAGPSLGGISIEPDIAPGLASQDATATPWPTSPRLGYKIVTQDKRIRAAQRRHAFAILCVPPLGAAVAVGVALNFGLTWWELPLATLMYVFSMLGMTVGYHRLLAHRSFSVHRHVKAFLLICGCLSFQGSPLYWAANHRRHHQFSDLDGDPHSPHFLPGVSGFWHSHVSWMYEHELSNPLFYCKDLYKDRVVTGVNRYYTAISWLGVLAPAMIGLAIESSVLGALRGALWGGAVRVFLSLHATSCINSVTHLFGVRAFKTNDQSRNTAWLAILTLGEAWHNNHHAFPWSAHFGLLRGQLDLGGLFISALSRCGLALDVKRPDQSRLKESLIDPSMFKSLKL
jgi:acyl-CoA synthetase (AMP-forming)/AMP-acid ligase II/fatty-acid desaturase